jgi:hypothetical protein
MADNHIDIQSVESLPEYFADSSEIKGVSESTLKELGQKCKTRLDELKADRASSKYESEKQRDFDSYHLIPPMRQLPYVGYPNLACPLARIGVDTFHANVMFTFAGQEGVFRVLPDFLSKSHMDQAERAAQYMTYVLNYEAGLYDALDKADMDCNKYDKGFIKAIYVTKEAWEDRVIHTEETVPEIDELTGEVTPKTVKRKKKERVKKTLFDGVKFIRIHPESIFVSPFIETVAEAVDNDYLFEVSNYNFRRIEELSKGDNPFFKPSRIKQLKEIKRSEILAEFEQAKQAYDGYVVERKLELAPIELAEAHFRSDVNDDGLSEKISLVFETTTGLVLRATYADCRIEKLCPRPVDGRWDGESIRRATQPLLTEWEAIHNARVAKGQWANMPFGFYKAGGRFNPQTQQLMPGKLYPMDDTSSINFPQMPQVDLSYFQEEKLIMDYFDRVLALGDVIQGINGQKGTATETIHSQQRAGIRLSNPINRIAGALQGLVQHAWELIKQCGPEVKEFKIVGIGDGTPVFSKITSADYDAQVSFKLNMATMYDVQMLRDTALLNYKTFISNPLVMNNPASFYQLTSESMKALGLKVNIPKPEQAKARSPWVEHDLIRIGEDIEPVIGEDTDEHKRAHMSLIRSDEFKHWPSDAQQRLMTHYDKTQILETTLQAANLNQSGVFEGMPGGAAMPPASPGMTATRNPSQTMNNLRVEETGNSQRQNVQNGMSGGDNAPTY